MVRRNWFLRKYGKGKEWFYDLVLKPFAVGGLLFVHVLTSRVKMPVVDKRCHLFMQAVSNINQYCGDRHLLNWFQTTKWGVYMKLFGPDNGYIARDFLIMEEFVRLKHDAEVKGERFPDAKTDEYVRREIIAKKYDRLKVKHG